MLHARRWAECAGWPFLQGEPSVPTLMAGQQYWRESRGIGGAMSRDNENWEERVGRLLDKFSLGLVEQRLGPRGNW
jgi:hypothetical protein